MLVKPSFHREYCLSVDAQIPKSSLEKHGEKYLVPEEEQNYFLALTVASGSLWDLANAYPSKTNTVRVVPVVRTDRAISLALAVAIQRVWAKALMLTRYPLCSSGGYDGIKYQFFVRVPGIGALEGETWSPQHGLPLALSQIGNELVAFVNQDAKIGADLIPLVHQDRKPEIMTEEMLIQKLKSIEAKIPEA